ncbi:hypothetical protein RIF25_15775 [Thermosynechococcaceae cyanobacterium BACA0444]|uniref:Uncharacterized protein n=1 Tax=Pseudocalidococcus azoricus BACA0444 TaxID=2918990 RepID=A0AAE4JYJ9_9CYAN|nr:hypothetical protein [Pseudocalidococcus azoricus]MDS3862258.1 hypothetical protein [Pseudocalidococcus azoricus BACA0444]
METPTPAINCAEACVNGCVLGEKCPNREYIQAASKFIHDTPMDKLLEIAADSVQKRFLASLERDRLNLPPQD